MITDEKKLVHFFNYHYINIGERSYSIKSEQVEFDIGFSNKKRVLSSILDKYGNDRSIVEIHKNMTVQFSSISILSSSQNHHEISGFQRSVWNGQNTN